MVVGRIWRISGPLVVAENMRGSMIYEVVYVGNERLIGEIIGIQGDRAFIQVYEDVSGLSVGEPVEGGGKLLSAELGPGLIGKVFDGLQRPLSELEVLSGPFVRRGVRVPPLPRDVKWLFRREKGLKIGDKVGPNDVLGYVDETPLITHKIMVPPNVSGYLKELVSDGDYRVDEVIARVGRGDEVLDVMMYQEWPIRKARPYIRRLEPTELLVTGTRVLDALFPIAVGGKAAVPGGFGSGKCVVPGTPVLLADGSLKIIDKIFEEAKGGKPDLSVAEEVYELEPPLAVYGFSGGELKITVATHVYRGFTEEIVRVKTSSGRLIEVTPDHRLPVYEPDGKVLELKAKELKPGMLLIVPRKIPMVGDEPASEIPLERLNVYNDLVSRDEETNRRVRELLRQSLKLGEGTIDKLVDETNLSREEIEALVHKGVSIPLKLIAAVSRIVGGGVGHPKVLGLREGGESVRIPDRVTEELAELLGLILSNGKVVGQTVMFFSNNEVLLRRVSDLMKSVFGVERKESGNANGAEVRSALVVRLLKVIGIPDVGEPQTHEVPEIIMRAPNNVVTAFLRGLFLGGGTVSGDVIKFTTSSKKLAIGTTYLLSRLGILYTVDLGEGRNTICIARIPEARKFIEKVLHNDAPAEDWGGVGGHMLSSNEGGLVRAFFPTSMGALRNVRDVVPKEALGSEGTYVGSRPCDEESVGVRASLKLTTMSMNVSGSSNQLVECLEGVSGLHECVALDEVKSVEVIHNPTVVYDLVVPSTHNFVGGYVPTIFHNTVLLQTLTKWSRTQVNIYVGCGERGNEMADALHSFKRLVDPTSGRPLYEKAIFIANTSNMPVAARETSVFLGATLGEYFRDMGYDVLLVADSTSRWAEAMREISARMEEMPGEEGFPAYLGSRLASFYERSGRVECVGSPSRNGSLTIVGAVSPPGADFSEPVTQNTLRYIGTLISLDVSLANRRHFPSVSWLLSYSLYVDNVSAWWSKLGSSWSELRREFIRLLQKEAELMEIVRLVGPDALPEQDKLVLEVSRMIREDFLQQSAYHPIDSYSPPEKTLLMMDIILRFYRKAYDALLHGVSLNSIKELPARVKIARMKEVDPKEFREFYNSVINEIEESLNNLMRAVG